MNDHWLFKLALSLLCLIKGCYGQAITDNLRMVWNDEFNGSTLDVSKWSVPPAWFRQGGCYWSDDNFEMTGNGKVKLSVTESNDGTVYCGALRTHNKFDKKYGYFETRCTVPQIHGGWAAFWMMPYQNQPGNAGNDGTEIDIFESIDGWKGKIRHALHWDGYGVEHQHVSEKMDRPDLYDGQYHVFGMMWTPEEYIFYIDNEETWRTSTAGVSDVNQYLKLTLEVSGQTWAGDWNNQVIKPINWFVDYVRVYDYEPNVNLEFTALTNDQTFYVGDQVQMHVGVTGTMSQIDEIKFFTKKGNEPYLLRKTSDITSQNTYWYNWFPDQAGTYKLKAKGFKNGSYVTNVVVGDVNVKKTQILDPLTMAFTSMSSGDNYKVGDTVDMSVELSGDLSDADEIQYLTRKDDGEFVLQETQSLTGSSTYEYSWTATESGTYSLRITAKNSGIYVTHVVVGGIYVEGTPTVAPTHASTEAPTRAPNPFSMAFTSLNSGENYDVGNAIDMSVELFGDLSGADEIQYLTRKDDGKFVVQTTQSLTDSSSYEYSWSPTGSGTYAFRITAKKSGIYVTHVVVGDVVIEEAPLNLEYKVLQSGSTCQIGKKVKMHVILSGNYASIDKIKFIVQKIGESGSVINSSVIKTATVREDKAIYHKKWTPSEAGYYRIKVSAYLDNLLVDAVIANVTIE